jgi:gliding motility-associated-like protein
VIPNTTGGGYYLDTTSTCVLRYDYTLQERPLPELSFINPVDVVEESDQVRADLATTVDGTSVSWQIAFINNIDTNVVQTGSSGSTFDIGGIYQYLQYVTLDDSVSPGSIQVTFIPTANGCVGAPLIDTISINPIDIPIFIPEVFTPDGEDEFNPTWNIQWTDDINPLDYEIIVYNRSGGQVHEMSELNPYWTGDSAPDGVYWWVLIEKSSNRITKSGGLTIKRK